MCRDRPFTGSSNFSRWGDGGLGRWFSPFRFAGGCGSRVVRRLTTYVFRLVVAAVVHVVAARQPRAGHLDEARAEQPTPLDVLVETA